MSHVIDLSHPIESGRTGYPGLPAPRVEAYITHEASRAAYGGQAEFEVTRLFMVGNTGTYLDSPYHRHRGGSDVADLPLSSVAALPCIRLDARFTTDRRRIEIDLDRRTVRPEALVGAALLIRTGWDAHYGTPDYWRPGPYVPGELAERIAAARVALVGVDCSNIDDTADPERPAHTRLLAAGIPIVEHLRGLDRLPRAGSRFHAAPIAIRGAASVPVRAYAEVTDRGVAAG